jgi:hypothetical protein
MSACNFEYLLQFVNRQLDLDKQLEVYDHLDRCDICREAVYQISRDLDGLFTIYCAHCVKPYAMLRRIDAAGSGRAQTSANGSVHTAVRRNFNHPS